MPDLLQADIDRVYGEYFAAREEYEKTSGEEARFVKARFDQAQSALRETRRLWREIGEATGTRKFITTEDNAEPPPDLIGDAWIGRRHYPKGA